MNRIVTARWRGHLLTAEIEDGRICRFLFPRESGRPAPGEIRIGRVENIVRNIQAAFINLGCGYNGYCPLNEHEQRGETMLRAGDELPVQIVREGTDSKLPMVSRELTLTGRCLILTNGRRDTAFSRKISDEEWKSHIHELLAPLCCEKFGFIVRTSAYHADDELIVRDAQALTAEYSRIAQEAAVRPVFTILRKNPPAYLKWILGADLTLTEGIQTDDPSVYEELRDYLTLWAPQHADKLTLYQDPVLPLDKLHRFDSAIEEALREKIWLPSGGFLMIQRTEALVSIDVNSGRFDGRRSKEETFLTVNLEAAREIAHQLRLRNLSGIIIIDFIDMAEEENDRKLLSVLEEEIKKDPVKAALAGITKLHLVEMTRQKIEVPLADEPLLRELEE